MQCSEGSYLHNLPSLPLKARELGYPYGQALCAHHVGQDDPAPIRSTEYYAAANIDNATIDTAGSRATDLPAVMDDVSDERAVPGHALPCATDAGRLSLHSCSFMVQQACIQQHCDTKQPHHPLHYQQMVSVDCHGLHMKPGNTSLQQGHYLSEQHQKTWAIKTALVPSGSMIDGLGETASCFSSLMQSNSSSSPGQMLPAGAAPAQLHVAPLMQSGFSGQHNPTICIQQTPVIIGDSPKGLTTTKPASLSVTPAADKLWLDKATTQSAGQVAKAATAIASLGQVMSGACGCVMQPHEGCAPLPGLSRILQETDAQQCGSSDWAQDCSAHVFGSAADECARQVRVHCVTFNMGNKVPPSIPKELFGLPGLDKNGISLSSAEPGVDLYVFATQESGSIADWEQLIGSNLPAGYIRLAHQTLRAIHLVLYASGSFQQQVLSVKGTAVATGIGNLVGNKGAVALAVQLLDMKLLFISSHFAAHDNNVERRNADFARIKASLFQSSSYSNLTELTNHTSSLHADHNHSRCSSATLQQSLRRPACLESTGGSWCITAFRLANEQQHSHHVEPRSSFSRSAVASPRDWRLGAWSRCSASVSPLENDTGMRPTAKLHGHSKPSSMQQAEIGIFPHEASAEGTNICRVHLVCNIEQQQLHTTGLPLSSAGSILAASPSSSACDTQCSPRRFAIDIPNSPGAWVTTTRATTAQEHKSMGAMFSQSPTQLAKGTLTMPDDSCDVTADHDVVFWLGDLNYRINGNTRSVGYLLRSKLHEVLHANDQLRLQQRKGRVFQGFHEGAINFPPTFKFIPGTSDYSDQRVPSWTDRILWKIRPREAESDPAATVTQLYYQAVPEVICSDHKPVVAGFELLMSVAEVPIGSQARDHIDSKNIGRRCNIM